MAAARGSAAAMGGPAPSDGVRRRRAGQFPPARPARAHACADAARCRHGAKNVHRHRQPGRRRGALQSSIRGPPTRCSCSAMREATSDGRSHPPHRRRAGPPRVDAAGVAGAAAECVPGGRARARLPPPVRSDASSIRAASATCSAGRHRCRWTRACAVPCGAMREPADIVLVRAGGLRTPTGIAALRIFLPATAFAASPRAGGAVCGLDYPFTVLRSGQGRAGG